MYQRITLDIDDAYQKVGEATKDVDTRRKDWWRPIFNMVLYPLIVIGLIVLLFIQMFTV